MLSEKIKDQIKVDAGAVLSSLCIFCGERDESFTEDGLDLHYWKHCPMLQRCLQCRQVHTHPSTCAAIFQNNIG